MDHPDNRYTPLLFLSLIVGICFARIPAIQFWIPFFFLIGYFSLFFTFFTKNSSVKRMGILFFISFLLFSYGYSVTKKPVPIPQTFMNPSKNITVTGTISDYPQYTANRVLLHVRSESYQIRVKIKYKNIASVKNLQKGCVITLTGHCEELEKYLAPHESLDLYLKKQNINGVLLVEENGLKKISPPPHFFDRGIHTLREMIEHNLARATRNNSTLKNLLYAIFLNKKTEINREFYAEIGIAHLLSISGFHFSLLSLFLFALLGSISPKKKIWIYTPIMLFYLCLIGFPISAVRSFLILFFLLLSQLAKRKSNTLNTLFLVGLLLILFSPHSVLSVAFWLSFLGTVALCVPISRTKQWLLLFVLTGLILGMQFHMISYISIASSAFFSLFLASFFIYGFMGIFLPATVSHFLYPSMNLFFEALQFIAKALHSLPFSYRYISEISQRILFASICILFLGIVIAFYYSFQSRWKKIILGCTLASMCILFFPIKSHYARIVYFNVGEGDCALIQSPNQTVLLDSGENMNETHPAQYVVLPYLKKMGVNHLDFVILSHYHSDHYGGFPYLINHIPRVDILLVPDTKSTDEKNFFQYMQKECIFSPCYKKIHQKVSWQKNASDRVEIFAPFSCFAPYEEINENNRSLLVQYTYGRKKFLFLGDLEVEGEQKAIQYFKSNLVADVVKIGHHGSRTSSSEEFLQRIHPDLAIISCGPYSFHRHPSQEVITRLTQMNIPYMTTYQEGTIVLETDGANIWQIES